MKSSLPIDVQNNMKSLLIHHKSISEVSRALKLSKSVVSRYNKKWFPNQTPIKGGRPTIVADNTKNIVRRKVLKGDLNTANAVHKYLMELGYDLTSKTAANVLKSMNFLSGIKKKRPFLSLKHRAARLQWAKRHQHWTVDDWKRVVFSDETKVNVWGSDGCKYYWSRPGDELKPHHLDLTVKYGGGGIMVWGCITYWGPGYACNIYDGTMKSEDYQHILSTTYKETLDYYGLEHSDVYFQQDNDPKHKSKSTLKWMENEGITLLEDWPAQSPDLNPIEHVWHQVKVMLSGYDTRADGVHTLWERFQEQWDKITENECKSYINSMPKRIQAVIKAKGGNTKY